MKETLTFLLLAFLYYALMASLPYWACSPAIFQMKLHINYKLISRHFTPAGGKSRTL